MPKGPLSEYFRPIPLIDRDQAVEQIAEESEIAMKKIWCVRSREGWCATATGRRESTTNVKTRCGRYVVLPWGSALRRPDCANCIAKLSGSKA